MNIGFMQGQLSPMVEGKIQAFPWLHWWKEFETAHVYGFTHMEWTIGQSRIERNPLMSRVGQEVIQSLIDRYSLNIQSLTGDCFMQAPFWKAAGLEQHHLLEIFKSVLNAAAAIRIRWIVVPLVDNGRLETEEQTEQLLQGMETIKPLLTSQGQKVVFESDFSPSRLRELIDQLDPNCFGINYDSGNSAALGYDPEEEIKTYGDRIDNVRIKDRLLDGITVPLGEGNADLPRVCKLLQEINYSGQYILQTARTTDGDHVGALCRYRTLVQQWLA